MGNGVQQIKGGKEWDQRGVLKYKEGCIYEIWLHVHKYICCYVYVYKLKLCRYGTSIAEASKSINKECVVRHIKRVEFEKLFTKAHTEGTLCPWS